LYKNLAENHFFNLNIALVSCF